jgi:ribosomal protein S18 acetylase RimI-like enzyme
MDLVLRKLTPADKPQWLELWAGYLTFYEHELSSEQTELSWQRLLNGSDGLNALVAEQAGKLVGLAHYFWTPTTWQLNQDLYLEDLFVSPDVRGHGVGKKLISELIRTCKDAGGSKVHWQTHHTNRTAIGLYQKLGKQSEFIVFETKLD